MRAMEADLAELSGTAADLETQVGSVTAARDLAQARVRELGATVTDLRAQLREAGGADGEATTVLRNQLNQALTDQDGALEAQRQLEARVTELEAALEEANAAAAAAAAAIPAGADPEIETLVSARGEAEAARDDAIARADALEAELQALETRIAEIAAAEAGSDSGALALERDAALAARDAALSARDAARRDAERAQSDLQRMAANLAAAEAEADRLALELRAARAQIEVMLAANTVPNPGPNTPAVAGNCPTWTVAGPEVAYTGTDIYSPQTLTTTAGGTTALSGCTDLPAGTIGFANAVPNYSLLLSEMAQFRRLELEVVAADCDTTLLVNTHDTAWHFDNDGNGDTFPILNLTGPRAIEGRIDVWIGTVDGSSCTASLEVETWLN